MELRHLRYFVAVAEELHFGHAASPRRPRSTLLTEARSTSGFVGLSLEAEGLVTETTGRVRLMVALPEKHPIARKNELRLEELSKGAYVLQSRHAAICL